MGRRYYCNYCDKTFPNNSQNRRNHTRGIQHTMLKRLYYTKFKDPMLLLQEEQTKRFCNKFAQQGYCEFGDNCKYSHYTNEDLINIIQRAQEDYIRKQNTLENNINRDFDVNRWVEDKLNGINSYVQTQQQLSMSQLHMPPSLRP
ncbi:unnamed protein product [Didymodactylos carnosus]|uniref:C3H1-type domain-containing protein n=1 Tax=Didymodactylos carnosus TaxID=1234261 RepID=A0A813VK12_9BILA|nr:unnamed protein product [Didymodactylos carnosus]CAF1177450.1 unnamed protein product [Didymodactylos carnosus]CAF3631737.1 unnamed protein product [Didymodactylos carnosus]CAF3988670.1 unnamed protein product [Didymodactylos carnosus]